MAQSTRRVFENGFGTFWTFGNLGNVATQKPCAFLAIGCNFQNSQNGGLGGPGALWLGGLWRARTLVQQFNPAVSFLARGLGSQSVQLPGDLGSQQSVSPMEYSFPDRSENNFISGVPCSSYPQIPCFIAKSSNQ